MCFHIPSPPLTFSLLHKDVTHLISDSRADKTKTKDQDERRNQMSMTGSGRSTGVTIYPKRYAHMYATEGSTTTKTTTTTLAKITHQPPLDCYLTMSKVCWAESNLF